MNDQLLTISLLLFFAILGSILASKFKQPAVLGLLIIGMIIGPSAFNIVHNIEIIDLMIEFGSILFLFVLGMEFSLTQLKKIGGKALIASIFKVGIMFFVIFVMVIAFGFDFATAAFAGVAFSFSSTTIITNILKQKSLINRNEMPLLIGILVLEDIFGVIALTFFAASKNTGAASIIRGVEHLFIGLAILIATYVLVSIYAEKISKWLIKQSGDEIITLIGLGICAGFSYFAYLLSLSPSAGAFLAGSIVSTFKASKQFELSVKPYLALFASFFFISMGTLINVNAILKYYLIIIGLVIIIIIISLQVAVGFVTRIIGNYSKESAMFSSIVMLPPGVFSMLVAKESAAYGISLDLITIVSVIILIMTITLSLFVTKSNKYVWHSEKISFINILASKISTFFAEMEMDHPYTKKLKKQLFKIAGICLSIVIIAFSIYEISNINLKIVKYLLFTLIFFIMISLIYLLVQAIKNANIYTIKIFSNLQGGSKLSRTNDLLPRPKGRGISGCGVM
ncbi:cation:proton antiporter [Candidatus Woesearchaeota archaeon]|nr:cation:proton antiporter [Candidatus Woesearchaeota archaeon]MCF7901650.1 cation:proton antiporter [Candidatus Woesearchaeota archaeon]MCF8014043.1 cation:proton antiporter [Candidatus Woesearchaeota archaeon]